MEFKLEMDCNNDAFAEDLEVELARILRDVANKVRAGHGNGPVRDSNGNKVGSFEIIVEEEETRHEG